MNVNWAIDHLLKKGDTGIHSIENDGQKYIIKFSKHNFQLEYSARELIKFAKVYSSDNPQHTAIKRSLKKYTHRRNRSHTRDLINMEDFDKIPQNQLIHKENPRGWD